jgi:hypothetical protein
MKAPRPRWLSVLLVALALAAPSLRGQAFGLTTTYAGGNGLNGAMFDLAATGGVPLLIQDFDINTASSVAWQVYVVTAQTSWYGLDNTPGAWTLLATTPVIPGSGTGVPTQLNLNLGYLIPGNSQKVGFYITSVTASTLTYTNGTVTNQLYASNTHLSFYEGKGKALPQFSGGFDPRVFNGTIYYDFGVNILSLNQSGPGVGDLNLSVGNLSPGGAEGYLLISGNLATPVGLGPILGITPDAGTFSVFSVGYFPGNPVHFNGQDPGVFPQQPFLAPPGSLNGLTGTTLDVALFMFNVAGGYDSRSNVVRRTFQ